MTSLELMSSCNTDGSKGDCRDQTSSESSTSAPNQVLWHIPLMYVTGEEPRLPRGPFLWARERETRLEGLPPPDKYVVINPENIGILFTNYYLTFQELFFFSSTHFPPLINLISGVRLIF